MTGFDSFSSFLLSTVTGLNSIFFGSCFCSALVFDAGNAKADFFSSPPNGLNPNSTVVVGAALVSFFSDSNVFFGESEGVLMT